MLYLRYWDSHQGQVYCPFVYPAEGDRVWLYTASTLQIELPTWASWYCKKYLSAYHKKNKKKLVKTSGASSNLVFSIHHTGLGHASPPCPPLPATACSSYLCEWRSILRSQAASSAIPTDAAYPTYWHGQRWLSSAAVPRQRHALYAVSPLQQGAPTNAHAQGKGKCS